MGFQHKQTESGGIYSHEYKEAYFSGAVKDDVGILAHELNACTYDFPL